MRFAARFALLGMSILMALATSVSAQVGLAPFRASVRSTLGCDTLILEDGQRVRLQGVSLPTRVVRRRAFASETRRWLAARVVGTSMWIEPETELVPASENRPREILAIARFVQDGPSIQADMVAAGRALFCFQTPDAMGLEEVQKAAKRAQDARVGWFKESTRSGPVRQMPYLNGAVIGLQQRDPAYRYEDEIDELAAAGFRTVSFIFASFLRTVESHDIDRHHERSVPDRRLIEAIRHAREVRGMRVMLLPIVLILDADEDDWRGTLRPTDEEAFWVEYDSMLAHYLDIAEWTGVEMVSVGSELGSLEDRTETWLRLIANARGRFTGLLTYSANWDHVHVPRFFRKLDAVGMTAYFSVSVSKTPSLDELREGWERVEESLQRALSRIERPVFFTEIGYASQDGIGTNPWNYFIAPDDVDVEEQALCFEAALTAIPAMDFLSGAFWFEYTRDSGRGDSGYSPRGKPAMEIWKRWARVRVDRPVVALPR